jgi:cell wall-associated NlpC family hydrolase
MRPVMRPSVRLAIVRPVIARGLWLAVAALPSGVLAAEVPDRSFAVASLDQAARAAERVWQGTQDLGQFALGLIGVEYRYGGETPDRGLDCSGLIRYVFQQVTGVTLPRTARELSRVGARVGLNDLQTGDLVFFNTRNFAFSHVGLYLGDDRFIHAPRRGREVEVSTLSKEYWQRHFSGARRLVGVLPALIPTIIPEALAAAASSDDIEKHDAE